MRVLQQLITYFWERGSLTAEQAHYFVEHGFVRSAIYSATSRASWKKMTNRHRRVGTMSPTRSIR